MEDQILRLNMAGQPVEWLHWKEAVCLYVRERVRWNLGGCVRRVYGGRSSITCSRSQIDLPAIIACSGRLTRHSVAPVLTNTALFARDNNQCLYCGQYFTARELSRDHIHPVSRGGRNRWENVVAACLRCNQHKGSALLSETSMQLLALPFRPNPAEYLALINSKRIRADQMEYLLKSCGRDFQKRCLLTCH